MYRPIECGAWDDPKVMQLDTVGKLLFFYLITNRATHACGLYHLALCLMAHQTGIPLAKLPALLKVLSDLELVFFDEATETVFVKSMFRYQARGEKMLAATRKQILTLHASKLILKFLQIYPEVANPQTDTPSIPHGCPIDTQTDSIRRESGENQKREQEQKKEPLKAENALRLTSIEIAQAVLVEDSTKRKNGEIGFTCPVCDKPLVINRTKDLWHCFGCDAGGGAWKLAAHLASVDPNDKSEVLAWLAAAGLRACDPAEAAENR